MTTASAGATELVENPLPEMVQFLLVLKFKPPPAAFPPEKIQVGEEGVSEMGSAVREAQACGARVLLGDRDFEVCRRRFSQQAVQVGW